MADCCGEMGTEGHVRTVLVLSYKEVVIINKLLGLPTTSLSLVLNEPRPGKQAMVLIYPTAKRGFDNLEPVPASDKQDRLKRNPSDAVFCLEHRSLILKRSSAVI